MLCWFPCQVFFGTFSSVVCRICICCYLIRYLATVFVCLLLFCGVFVCLLLFLYVCYSFCVIAATVYQFDCVLGSVFGCLLWFLYACCCFRNCIPILNWSAFGIAFQCICLFVCGVFDCFSNVVGLNAIWNALDSNC